ncbi:ABC transporter substrate-binding protein [Thermodesulfobacteriota bacterium]
MEEFKSGLIGMTSQNWLTFIAQEKNMFTSAGLAHNYISFKSMREGLEKVKTGVVPICSSAADTPIIAIDKGLPVKIIGALNRVAFGHIVARPEIASIKDLAGKRIGTIDVDLGSTIIVKEVLRAGGLKESEYKLICLGSTVERYAALVKNEIEATYLSPPYDFKAQEEGYVFLADFAKMFPDYVISIYANQKFLSRNTDISVMFLKALAMASRWIYDPANRKEAIHILCEATQISKSYGEKSYDYIIEESKGIAKDCMVDFDGLKRLSGIMKKSGLIEMKISSSDYVNDSFLTMALKDSKTT